MKNIDNLFSPTQNFAGLTLPYTDFETARAVILPVPYDGTTEWHSGTREGPMAIIDASPYLEFYDIELDCEIHKVGIHTMAMIQPVTSGPEDMIERVYMVATEIIKHDKLIVMLGGEHSLSLGLAKALKGKYKELSVLQFDAHADLRNEYMGTKFNNACVMRCIMEHCPVTQVGIRSLSLEEKQFIDQNKMNTFYNYSLTPDLSVLPEIINSLNKYVYISIDFDVFDPSIMPSVGTPEPDGMKWNETLKMLREVCRQRNVVGFDLMELCPSEGHDACSFFAAKLAYKLIGYALLQK
jgi:agmatinase